LYWWALGLFVLGLDEQDDGGDAAGGAVGDLLVAARPVVVAALTSGRWAPFFVLGLLAGPVDGVGGTQVDRAEGAAFDLTIVERCLLAGRAIWFYLGKLFWPRN